MMRPIYLDYAAATPLDPEVLATMQPYFTEEFYNPSTTYAAGRQVRAGIDDARRGIALVMGARSSDIIFTAGATEANNLALSSIMQTYPGKRLVVSAIEHPSVRETAQQFTYTEWPVTPDGIIDLTAAGELLQPDVVLVSVMYANNEVGTIQPLRHLAALVQAERKRRQTAGDPTPLYLHTDATQAANYLDLHVSRLGVDLMTLNGGKIYGPKQIGLLYAQTGVPLTPLIRGGGQERGMRSGTENVAGIIGMCVALERAQAQRHDETQRLHLLQTLFLDLFRAQIPAGIINGSLTNRLPNNVHVTIPGHDNERLLMALDNQGIMVATGSACSASNEEPSHVLAAMDISESLAQSSLRFTMGRATTETDIRCTVTVLEQLVR